MTDAAQTRLAEVLRKQFRTRAGFARALGVARTTVNRWCSGEEPVPAGRRDEIAGLLGVPREELFPEEGLVA